jgi:hypothetical protein
MPYPKNYLPPCPACGQHKLGTIETRKNPESIRRRKKCQNCGKRTTTYEMSSKFYEEALRNQMLVRKLLQLIEQKDAEKTPNIWDEAPKCPGCNYNTGTRCSFGLPEYMSPDSFDCANFE